MLTAKDIYDTHKNDTDIETYIKNKLEFEVGEDEDGKYETDNKAIVIEGVSELLTDRIGVDADDWTDAHGKLCDEAAEMIIDDKYDDLKFDYHDAIEYAKDPYKYYGLRRSDF